MHKFLIGITVLLLLVLSVFVLQQKTVPEPHVPVVAEPARDPSLVAKEAPVMNEDAFETVDFSTINPDFRFAAKIPTGWKVEVVPSIQALNVYDPSGEGSAREQSQIFIRQFTASNFQTLTAVDVLSREELRVADHQAVRYEIKKKSSVRDFPDQPSWRNEQHTVTDVRFTSKNPSVFYVFAKRPSLSQEVFDSFLQSLVFHNDRASFVAPISRANERVTKKPFGVYVTPTSSPVSPEKFSGYHTGVDFETFVDEQTNDVPVVAICGGKLRSKQRAAGYGGVAVQDCFIDDQPITVVYGHLRVASITRAGEYLSPGEQLGVLGTGYSSETDGERKHLHLGIHLGSAQNIRGYVAQESELRSWLNPLTYISYGRQ